MTYAFCNHEIAEHDSVLAIYPEGDCDTGTVVSFDPFDYFGTVVVSIGNKTRKFLVEDVSHMNCDED